MSSPTSSSRTEVMLLDPACTREDAAAVIGRAVVGGYAAVCLPPTLFPLRDAPEDLRLVSVAGYPTGKHHPLIKASEAHMAVVNGAHEVHAVLDTANVVAGDLNAMISEIVTLREAVPYPAVLRVSPGEDGTGGDLDGDRVRVFCRAAVTAGADMVWACTDNDVAAMLEAVAGSTVAVAAPVDRAGVARVRVFADGLGYGI
ncbi:2-deoxyribose-5-phosphate aldolase [Corynebacterium glyciniphilum]|uniref:2-deoxyribose-5-phosphate aldolase n=1 Tax=Corynebacterium glyciniphilum TaxID=1404244 RepID=UPI003DA05953